jgi:hypothetical protein
MATSAYKHPSATQKGHSDLVPWLPRPRRSLLRVPKPFVSLVASCYLGFLPTFLVFVPCSAGQVAGETCREKNGSHCYGGDRKRWTGSRSRTLAPPRGAAWIVDRDPG